jgi:GalNAc-alpha-(1->4)-GalNAc-alpha-(1->3)-diNAcBac-PP-undecaprenol alpha-1,4-N-acetyl-D-galactosaminyltransferase
MKLLFSIKSMLGEGGGAEKVLADVASGLSARGHDVSILTLDHPGSSFYHLSPSVTRYGMACNAPNRTTNPMAFLQAVPKIRRTVRKIEPDMVIAFMHSMYVPLTFTLLGSGLPLIASEHTVANHYLKRPLQNKLRRWAEARSSLVTIPSEAARATFLQPGERDRAVVFNPVNLTPFAASIGLVAETPPIVVSVGRFMAEKDHSTLLKAFAQVAPEFPDWKLRLVGDGVLRPALEAERRALGLEGRVEMPGFTRDVANVYANARFVVMASRYESFGLVAAEALASGRALLGFDDCAGISEIVTDGENGLLVPAGSSKVSRTQTLAEGLRRLMGDKDLCIRLGSAGPAAISRFSLPSVIDRWEEVIRIARSRKKRFNQ